MLVTTVVLSLLVVAVSSEETLLTIDAFYMAERSEILAFNLYQNLAKEKDLENILISPVVVASSLGLVALGDNACAAQVKMVLSSNQLDDEQLHSGLAELWTEVSNSTARNVTWKVRNCLYGPSSVDFTEDFVETSKKYYNFEHAKMNFEDKESTVKSINEWVNKSTNGKIPEIMKDVEMTDGAMMISAMFFKTYWNEAFHPKMVDRRSFLVESSFAVSITMMHSTGIYGFHEDVDNKLYVLSMPLALKKSSMVFIMPYHLEPLERLEKLLSYKQLNSWLSKLKTRAVSVSLPKVSMEVSHDLQSHLAVLGLTDAVNKTKADLSFIFGKKGLYLSNIIHASAFEWDIKGNPFDASIFGTEKLSSPRMFYVDHPFIFLVMDNKTKSILFIGRLVHPKGEKVRDEL